MTFKENLFNILNELKQHKNKKEDLKIKYVENRLNETVERYYDELNKSLTSLLERNELKVLKNLKEDK